MSADGAVRDFGRLQGVTQGASPQRAVTEEQRRSRAKDPPLRICSPNTCTLADEFKVPNAAAGIYGMASRASESANAALGSGRQISNHFADTVGVHVPP